MDDKLLQGDPFCEFWKQVFLTAIRAGQSSSNALAVADFAANALKIRVK